MKATLYECDTCGKEVTLEQGQMRDLPYDELIGQVFLCLECAKEDNRILERFESGEPFTDELS